MMIWGVMKKPKMHIWRHLNIIRIIVMPNTI